MIRIVVSTLRPGCFDAFVCSEFVGTFQTHVAARRAAVARLAETLS